MVSLVIRVDGNSSRRERERERGRERERERVSKSRVKDLLLGLVSGVLTSNGSFCKRFACWYALMEKKC